MTATTTNNNKIDYTTIVDGKEEEDHWIRKSVLFITLLVCVGLYSTTNNTTRFVNNVPVAATSSLVRGGDGTGVRDGVRGGRIQVTQWNSHWENSVTATGPLKTQGVVDNLVYGNDFVNLIMFEDRNWVFGGAYRKITNGDYCTKDKASWDMLVYDSSKWQPVNSNVHGCLYDNDRPFVVQKFKNSHDGTEVTVVGAHFPHPGQGNFYQTLASKIGQVSGGPGNKIIFMGDINDGIPSQTLFDRLGLGALKVASDLYNTCCFHDGFEAGAFDRIGANFGSNAHTIKFETLLFDPNPTFGNSGEYHKPVQLTFNY